MKKLKNTKPMAMAMLMPILIGTFGYFLPAKPVVVFKLEKAKFEDFWRLGGTHFVIGFAGLWHKRENC